MSPNRLQEDEKSHAASPTTTSEVFRVLVADDHALMRQILGAILESYPNLAIIAEATNGMEAVSLALALNPDGIIMDINMPQIDGIEATKHIKAAQPEIRVLGLSVINDKHVTEAMQVAGAEAVLVKDDLMELHEAMRRWSTPELHKSPSCKADPS